MPWQHFLVIFEIKFKLIQFIFPDPAGPLFFQERVYDFLGLTVTIKGLSELQSGDAK